MVSLDQILAWWVSSADLPPAWQAGVVAVGVPGGIGLVELAVWRKRTAAARRRRREWRRHREWLAQQRRRHH